MPEIAQLLEGARQGDRQAIDELFATLYGEFRKIAHARLRKIAPLTLVETTVLVNESYLRLVRTGKLAVNDRVHFLAYAARVMRSIIVDLVRERMAERRGSGQGEITLNTAIADAVPCRRGRDSRGKRSTRIARQSRAAAGAGRRASLFRRPHRSGDCGGARLKRADRPPAMEQSAGSAERIVTG